MISSFKDTLTVVVQRLLDDDQAVVSNWSDEQVAGGLSGSSIRRFKGDAQTSRRRQSWSVIRKEISPAIGGDSPVSYNYWKRELLFYRSELIGDHSNSILTPRCIWIDHVQEAGLREGEMENRYWLWLEDMGHEDYSLLWPLEEFGIVARHLGQFNGKYLVGLPLPEEKWLGKPDIHERLALARAGIAQLSSLRSSPYFEPLLPDDHVERILQLWNMRTHLLAALDQLPQSFCHRDAFQRNLLIRRDKRAEAVTVALDWGSCGLGMLGEELVPLFDATVRHVKVNIARLAALDETIFHGYIAGLRDVGWRGDERLVRFGFTALTALKVAVADPAIKFPNIARRIAALPPDVEPPKLLNPGGYSQAAAISDYELHLGDEACRLLNSLR